LKKHSFIVSIPIVALGGLVLLLGSGREPEHADVVGTLGAASAQAAGDTETVSAFAFGPTCFHQFDENADGLEDFSSWGWSIGPLSELSHQYTFPLYAHAADCDVTRGELVGALDILYCDGNATFTFSTINGFELERAQLYAGGDMLPRGPDDRFTITPEEFPFVGFVGGGKTTTSLVVEDLAGEIFVVAHANVATRH